MQIKRINDQDLPILNSWCREWGMSPFPEGWLPPTGFWVPGVLAAFLYKTDSKLAYIECVISNPGVGKEERREALFAVNEAIEDEAKASGFQYLMGLSANKSITEAGNMKNYKLSEYKYATMVKKLEGNR